MWCILAVLQIPSIVRTANSGAHKDGAFLSKIDKVDQRSHCPAQAVAAVGNAGLRHAEVESMCACVCSVPTEDQPLNEINRNMLQVVFFFSLCSTYCIILASSS